MASKGPSILIRSHCSQLRTYVPNPKEREDWRPLGKDWTSAGTKYPFCIVKWKPHPTGLPKEKRDLTTEEKTGLRAQ